MIGTFLPHIAALASTKDGVHAAMLCFWHSIVKDRRVSILSFHLNLELGIIQIFQPISSIKSFINNFVTASLISRLFWRQSVSISSSFAPMSTVTCSSWTSLIRQMTQKHWKSPFSIQFMLKLRQLLQMNGDVRLSIGLSHQLTPSVSIPRSLHSSKKVWNIARRIKMSAVRNYSNKSMNHFARRSPKIHISGCVVDTWL